MSEQILCFPQSVLDSVGRFQGFSSDVFGITANLFGSHVSDFSLVDRDHAETDISLKQVVTYCVVMDPISRKIFCYDRSKVVGESRLAGKTSIGIGGHISEDEAKFDIPPSVSGIMGTVALATDREINEEISVAFDGENDYQNICFCYDIIGFINDDSNDVGNVHFGVCSLMLASEGTIRIKDEALLNPRWMLIGDMINLAHKGNIVLETWSLIVLGYIYRNLK